MIVDEFDIIDYEAGVSNETLGQECAGCRRLLTWKFFDRNSSYKSGYEPMCPKCREAPVLSIEEHTARLSEMNYNSEGTARQRHPDQAILHMDRSGRRMYASDFLLKLRHVCPSLYVKEGGIRGDLALYVVSNSARPDWGNRDFKYMGYVTLGLMPEYSVYEFDRTRDILLRASEMGWRSVLLRFIENKILTEGQCDKEFGRPSGYIASESWFKKIQQAKLPKTQPAPEDFR